MQKYDAMWGRNTAPRILSQQNKSLRMDIMAQLTPSYIILIILPCQIIGVNMVRNVARKRIFCIFVPSFRQYDKKPSPGSRSAGKQRCTRTRHTMLFLISADLVINILI